MKIKRIVMIAGGTGGHIIPALAVASVLAKHGVAIHWLGSNDGLEQQLVGPHWPISTIDAGRVRGKGIVTQLFAPLRLLWSTLQAIWVLQKLKPALVVAMGGFVTAPGGLAAKFLGKPLVIHEQNSIAGYSNRLLAKFADRILTAYPQVFNKKSGCQLVGNPVKTAITALPLPIERAVGQHQPLRLLILGGSQGAKAINELVTAAIAGFSRKAELAIWHQSGAAHYATTLAAYQEKQLPAKVTAFIDDMAQAYSWADVAICRAGALTIAELTAVGLGSLLVPLPVAVDDHQWHNGQYLVDQHAALMVRQNQLTVQGLQQQLATWLDGREQLLKMAENARALAKPQAAVAVAEVCLDILGIAL